MKPFGWSNPLWILDGGKSSGSRAVKLWARWWCTLTIFYCAVQVLGVLRNALVMSEPKQPNIQPKRLASAITVLKLSA